MSLNKSNNGSYKEDIDLLLSQTLNKALETLRYFNDYRMYCIQENLVQSEKSMKFIYNQLVSTISFITDSRNMIEATGISIEHLIKTEIDLRIAMQSIASIDLYLSWRSPARAQSVVSQFYNLKNQGSKRYYERCGHYEIQRIENQLLKTFGVSPDTFSCTVLNSGMSAYAVVEAFLIRHVLKPGDYIVISPYIYFETDRQLRSLTNFNIIHSEGYEMHYFIDIIEKHKPAVVLIDPIANTITQRMIDIQYLLEYFQHNNDCPVFVIDGTMMSCAVTKCFDQFFCKEKILYIESCSKYLQFGLDMSLAGVIIYDTNFKVIFNNLRQDMGAILTEHNANLFPIYKKEELLNRIYRIEQNACYIAQSLYLRTEITKQYEIIHPSLDSHPDNKLAIKMNRYGGCITFRLVERSTEKSLEEFVSILLKKARQNKVPIVSGESFGYSFPRINTIDIEGFYFIRFYVGDQSELNDVIVELLAQSLKQMERDDNMLDNSTVSLKQEEQQYDQVCNSSNCIITFEEIGKIVSAARNANEYGNRNAVMILILYKCSIQISELLDIKWSQIDLQSGLLQINRNNEVPILYPILGQELRLLRKIRIEYPESQFVFSTTNNKPIDEQTFEEIVACVSKEANIKKLVTPEILRQQRQKYMPIGENYYF